MSEHKITLRYLANAGFLIKAGGQKVLIDALHTRVSVPFSPVPAPLLRSILACEGEFQGVTCAAFTHLHRDHCELGLLQLLNAPEAHIILPRDPDRQPAWTKLRQPVVWLEDEGGVVWSAGGVSLTAFHSIHDRPEKIPPVAHYSYLLEYEGHCVLMLGDADVGESDFALWLAGREIDAVCVNFVEINQARGRRFLREVVRPKMIFPCHIPLPQDDVNHFQKMVARNVDRYQGELPPMFPCFESMQEFFIA